MNPDHWHWPQYTVCALYGLSLLIGLSKDGEPRTGSHSLAGAMLSVALSSWLLWSGGFFA